MDNDSAGKNLTTADIANAQRGARRNDLQQDVRSSDPLLDRPQTGTPNVVPLSSRTQESQQPGRPATTATNFPDLGPDRNIRPVASSAQGSASAGEASDGHAPLFPDNELQGFRSRWDRAQSSFVDEPRQAVQQADSLVASVVQRVAEQFAEERARLEKQWDRGDNVSTEDLRQALKRYRAFFDRLLSLG